MGSDLLTDIKGKTRDQLYGWIERQHPGTTQHTAAMREIASRKQRDNRIRVILGVGILLLVLVLAWLRQ